MAFRVTAPLVIARLTDGRRAHLYAGDVLPAEVDPANAADLLTLGMVEDLDAIPSLEEDLLAHRKANP